MSARPKGPNAETRRRIKRNLAARDGARCFYCAQPFPGLASATLDHLVPYSLVPTWRQANLVLACRACNEAKADQLPQAFLRPSGYAPGLVRRTVRDRMRGVLGTVLRTIRRRIACPTVARPAEVGA